jgi:hypothetical protein
MILMGIFNNKTDEEKEIERLAKEAKAEAKAAEKAAKEAAKEARLALYKTVQNEALTEIHQGFKDPVLYLTPTGIKSIEDGELKTIAVTDIIGYEHIPAQLSSYLKIPGGFYEPRYDKNDECIQILTKDYQVHTIKISKESKTDKIKIIGYLKAHGIESIE